jgi:8-oxo-dGTP pyrophosphatase MutT (NUDIX family)
LKSRNEVSAGGVVYRRGEGGIEVLICKDAGYHRWVLPKGLVDAGESFEQTAVREVEEEVGVVSRLVAPLGEERYVYTARGMRVFKTVHYFLLEYVSGSEANHDHEMEDVRWCSLDEAMGFLGYKGAKDVLARARDYLAAQPDISSQP